ncbi:hypothetical protein EHP00_1007 [Ecytonucleospora hepatopenaei]|uniref:Uncharacterized protein n=1 Tax=Ecytonucleospora hepatopenaei TaxID=646526 RepID=A0A1W0E682_9MICR|nr:hypothetical protein EHP00_1007 [Ecytonucleospora hepatopenaei]
MHFYSFLFGTVNTTTTTLEEITSVTNGSGENVKTSLSNGTTTRSRSSTDDVENGTPSLLGTKLLEILGAFL